MNDLQKQHTEELVKALESGEYKQTTGRLIRSGEDSCCYCVEGIACRVMGWTEIGDGFLDPENNVHTSGIPTYIFEEFFGFKNTFMPVINRSLIGLNDSDELSFKEIALEIHKNVLGEVVMEK